MALHGAPQSASATDVLMELFADGVPWQVATGVGRKAELTVNPDGTAVMEIGPLWFNLVWTRSAEGVCMEGGPADATCLSIMQVAHGFVAIASDGERLVLTRSMARREDNA
jgi:hypothetical protein